jgi:hypothetical protein
MDIKIAEEAERARQAAAKAAADAAAKAVADAAAKAAADKAAADAAAKAAADAAVVAPGVTTGDMVKAVTPTGPAAAELKAIIDAANAAAAAAGTATNAIDTRGSAATGSQSGVSKFLETYTAPVPFVAPTYTAPTVYDQLPAKPDIYAPGEVALDTAFRESSPRTEIPSIPGQFEYTPAAKLKPATGAGMSWTPPSVTSRPRSLLSPLAIEQYGGTTSASQRFAQDRQIVNNALRSRLSASPALRNTSTYNLLRNRVMSGEFGQNFNEVFNPDTDAGRRFEAAVQGLEASTTGTVADAVVSPAASGATTGGSGSYDVDPTDRQINAAGFGNDFTPSRFDEPIRPVDLMYGRVFAKGGEVTSSRRMLENLTAKNPERVTDEIAPLRSRVVGQDPATRLREMEETYAQNVEAGVFPVDEAFLQRSREQIEARHRYQPMA